MTLADEEEEDEFTFEFEDIPKEKYNELEKMLHDYMDGKYSRETYIKKVEALLSWSKQFVKFAIRILK